MVNAAANALGVALVSLVNIRFFRFNKPVPLALAVGGLTLALTVSVAVVLRSEFCSHWTNTVALPYIEPGAQCDSSAENQGWLKSNTVSASTATFTAASKAFQRTNYTDLWGGWMDALQMTVSNSSLLSHEPLFNSINPLGVPKTVNDVVSDGKGKFTVSGIGGPELLVVGPRSATTACTSLAPQGNGAGQRAMYKSDLVLLQNVKMQDFPVIFRDPYSYIQVNRTTKLPGSETGSIMQTCAASSCVPPRLALIYTCLLKKEMSMYNNNTITKDYMASKATLEFLESLQSTGQTMLPTCCVYSSGSPGTVGAEGEQSWCITPSSAVIVEAVMLAANTGISSGTREQSMAEIEAQVAPFMLAPDKAKLVALLVRYEEMLGLRCARLDNITNVEAKEVVDLQMVTFMAVAAEMATNDPLFHGDVRTSVASIGLQCKMQQCLSALSVLGITLSYVTWLQMLSCVLVLTVYLYLHRDEREMAQQVVAIAGKAPELVGHPDHKGGWPAGPGLVQRRPAAKGRQDDSASDIGGAKDQGVEVRSIKFVETADA